MQKSQDGWDIITSLISSFVIGLLSVVFTANLFANELSVSSVIAGVVYSAAAFVLFYNELIGSFKLKAVFSLAAVPIFSVLAIMAGVYSFAFERTHKEYVREYGGPNQGDVMGLMYMYIPAALVILLFIMALTYSLNSKNTSDDAKEG